MSSKLHCAERLILQVEQGGKNTQVCSWNIMGIDSAEASWVPWSVQHRTRLANAKTTSLRSLSRWLSGRRSSVRQYFSAMCWYYDEPQNITSAGTLLAYTWPFSPTALAVNTQFPHHFWVEVTGHNIPAQMYQQVTNRYICTNTVDIANEKQRQLFLPKSCFCLPLTSLPIPCSYKLMRPLV